jgi:hypothetical protein
LDHVVSPNHNHHRVTPKNDATSRAMTFNHHQLIHIFAMNGDHPPNLALVPL